MDKITGILYVREESKTEYRRWDDLTKEEVEKISNYLTREAARAGGCREAVPA